MRYVIGATDPDTDRENYLITYNYGFESGSRKATLTMAVAALVGGGIGKLARGPNGTVFGLVAGMAAGAAYQGLKGNLS